jgi:HlyD family secretion protein
MKKFGLFVVVVLLLGAGWWWFVVRPGQSAAAHVKYRTAKVERGEVIEGVAASGAVQPVELIQVGTQISGTIVKLNADFNSKVKAGDTIALLDSRRLASQVAQDEASLARANADVERVTALVALSKVDIDRARAAVAQSKADVDRVRAQGAAAKADIDRVEALLVQSKAELARQRQLVEKKLTSTADVDAAVASEGSLAAQLASAKAAVDQNAAQVAVAEAAVLQSEAGVAAALGTVTQNEAQLHVMEATVKQVAAQLEGDKVNLGYATILSPVDGVVVSRSVDVGQTVAASLSAPTLFLIARDLTKVQVQASVPEADVGQVHEKQPANFTVDAYPDKTFPGTVSQVRLASTTVQNVVTYTVIVEASNPDGLLFPGMTANVIFEVNRSKKDSLRVPATALRLQPAAELMVGGVLPVLPEPRGRGADSAAAPGTSEGATGAGMGDASASMADADASPGTAAAMDGAGGRGGGRSGGGGGGRSGSRGSRGGGSRRAFVFVPAADKLLRAVAVRVSISDGANTAVEPIEAGALDEGADVVTSIQKEEEAATTNPFGGGARPGGPRGGPR